MGNDRLGVANIISSKSMKNSTAEILNYFQSNSNQALNPGLSGTTIFIQN